MIKILAIIGLLGVIVAWLGVMAFLVAKLLRKDEDVYRTRM